jgi:hypothetical protein
MKPRPKLDLKLAKAIEDILSLFELDSEDQLIIRWYDKKDLKRRGAALKRAYEKAISKNI